MNALSQASSPLANASLLYEREARASGCTGFNRSSILDYAKLIG